MNERLIVTLTLNPSIDTFGEVDRLEPSQKLRCHSVHHDPGGGGINVARVLTRLGAPTLAVFPSGGALGERLEMLASAEALQHVAIRAKGETRENLTVRECRTGREYRFVFPGATLSTREVESCCSAALDQAKPGSWIVVSGSLPDGASPDIYARLAFRANKAGMRFAIDAAGAPLKEALNASPYLVKVNARELSDLTGMGLTTWQDGVNAAKVVLSRGARLVAVSWGEQGGLLVSYDYALAAAAPAIIPQSTVGAGDSFFAGLICALASGHAPSSALESAVASGSAALLAPGTRLARRSDIEALRLTVRAFPVSDFPATLSAQL